MDLQPIKNRLSAITPGEWKSTVFGGGKDTFVGVKANQPDNDWYHICSMEYSPAEDVEANALFVAHSKQDITNLVSEVERLRKRLEIVEAQHEEYLIFAEIAERRRAKDV